MSERLKAQQTFSASSMFLPLEPFVVWTRNGIEQDGVKCPECDHDNVHFEAPSLIEGHDNYKAGWHGRGDLIAIPFWCENGHTWTLCFGFHKGNTTTFMRIGHSESCLCVMCRDPDSAAVDGDAGE